MEKPVLTKRPYTRGRSKYDARTRVEARLDDETLERFQERTRAIGVSQNRVLEALVSAFAAGEIEVEQPGPLRVRRTQQTDAA
jgi:hypothetical protein